MSEVFCQLLFSFPLKEGKQKVEISLIMRNYNILTVIRIDMRYDIKQSGIYCILNTINGKFYIGSSINCYHRVKSHHFARLKAKTHNNPHLQSAYDLYGKKAFTYFIVEFCEPDKLCEIEQLYLDNTNCLNRDVGYNINQFADRIVLTAEQREKISAVKKGKPRDPETKRKMWEAIKRWRENATPEEIAAKEEKRLASLREAQSRRFLREQALSPEEKQKRLEIQKQKIKEGLAKARARGWRRAKQKDYRLLDDIME
jgi:group I intron endonuclease